MTGHCLVHTSSTETLPRVLPAFPAANDSISQMKKLRPSQHSPPDMAILFQKLSLYICGHTYLPWSCPAPPLFSVSLTETSRVTNHTPSVSQICWPLPMTLCPSQGCVPHLQPRGIPAVHLQPSPICTFPGRGQLDLLGSCQWVAHFKLMNYNFKVFTSQELASLTKTQTGKGTRK